MLLHDLQKVAISGNHKAQLQQQKQLAMSEERKCFFYVLKTPWLNNVAQPNATRTMNKLMAQISFASLFSKKSDYPAQKTQVIPHRLILLKSGMTDYSRDGGAGIQPWVERRRGIHGSDGMQVS